MNTEYQIVAAGEISGVNVNFVESIDSRELHNYQENRNAQLKEIEEARIVVEITTEFPSYESLGEGAWHHRFVKRVYRAVVARTADRLKRMNPTRPHKSVAIHLAWNRLHHNESGKPVYVQRWYIEKIHAALLGYSGRLGEESFADIILATWHTGIEGAEAWRSNQQAHMSSKQLARSGKSGG